ncbi:MAG: TusE/DsrC/DsvC family sulfur relay protein [Gammaproteobacteria bacterium]|jgi:tRNA 2-thiouridine synthesizing protein E|tara:strand:+ start:4820 stop:5164 length:345 start_codon:yes stop_codon:yes gene_type:complete
MTNANLIGINGHEVALDKDGYLLNLADWDERVATFLASQEEITLGPAHWEVINCLRNFYNRHQMSPPNRALVNLVKRDLGVDKGRSIYLMKLFRGTPAKTASKISGLPKPENCL